MRISESVAVRLALIGFFLVIALVMHGQVSEAGHAFNETITLHGLTIAP